MPTRIAGIQPGYLPWLGYFDQMRRVDAFIIADEMLFSTTGWAHHNRVRGPHGAHWLTLPARPTRGQRIADVPLDARVPWARDHLNALRTFYRSSPFAADLLAELERRLDASATRLVEASIPVIRWFAELLEIPTPLLVSSELGLERRYAEQFPDRPGPTHRIIAFMHALGASELLEGASGRDYLDVDLCARHGIRVAFQEYRHPIYRQLHEPFISHLSAIDLLLCAGRAQAARAVAAGA